MNTCKTCKWWKRDEPDAHYIGWFMASSGENTKLLRQFFKEHGEPYYGACSHPKFTYDDHPQTLDGMSYMDAESYAASMRTGQDFGCIHHEPKE